MEDAKLQENNLMQKGSGEPYVIHQTIAAMSSTILLLPQANFNISFNCMMLQKISPRNLNSPGASRSTIKVHPNQKTDRKRQTLLVGISRDSNMLTAQIDKDQHY